MPLKSSPSLATAGWLCRQNRFVDAEAEVQAYLELEPGNLQAETLLGVIYVRTGRLREAEPLLADIHRRVPRLVDAIQMLAFIRRAENDYPGAIGYLNKLPELGVRTPDLYNDLGSCWLAAGNAVKAGAAFKQAIELDRRLAHSYYNLGMALKLAGKSFETFATFRRAIELDPDFLDSYVQLWQEMRELQNWKEGLPILEAGLRRHPDSSQMLIMTAQSSGKDGQSEKAESLFKRASSLDPAALSAYAHWKQEDGQFEESIPILKEAIRRKPIQGIAYHNLAVAKCFDVDGKPLTEIALPLLERDDLGMEEQMFLHYALANTFDKQKQYERAIQHYDRANEHAYELYVAGKPDYLAGVDEELVSLEQAYTPEKVRELSRHGSDSIVPIFIVGMIRTGTTLLDQILSSHRSISSAGEQPFWQVSASRANRQLLLGADAPATIKELAVSYLETLRKTAPDGDRVTDKMPTNFMFMGIISSVFPKAKFIHIRRSPMDTCLSIYTTFLGRGTQFAYNKDNIISYYLEYLGTMKHWRSTLPPGQMIEIEYEELVTNKEPVLRDLLASCGLEWDEACLHHEDNPSQVSTPSLWTARQPVNTASVERWRRYEPWLGRLLDLQKITHPPANRPPPNQA